VLDAEHRAPDGRELVLGMVRGATKSASVLRSRGGSGSRRRSVLPFGVCGSRSSITYADGIM
jgi:hypothetical protein